MRSIRVISAGILLVLLTSCQSDPASQQNPDVPPNAAPNRNADLNDNVVSDNSVSNEMHVFTSRTASGQPIATLIQHREYQTQGFDVWEIGDRLWVKQVAYVPDLSSYVPRAARGTDGIFPPRMTQAVALVYCSRVHLTGGLFGVVRGLHIPNEADWVAFRTSMGRSADASLSGEAQEYRSQIFPDLHLEFWTNIIAIPNISEGYIFDGRTGNIQEADRSNQVAIVCVMDRPAIHSP